MGVNVREKAGWIEVKVNNRFEDWVTLYDFEQMQNMERNESLKKLGIELHDSRIKVIDIVEEMLEKQKKGNFGGEDEKEKLFVFILYHAVYLMEFLCFAQNLVWLEDF